MIQLCANLFAVWVVFGREVSSETPAASSKYCQLQYAATSYVISAGILLLQQFLFMLCLVKDVVLSGNNSCRSIFRGTWRKGLVPKRNNYGNFFCFGAALEKLLTGSAGKYATGDEADVFLAPQIAVATKRFNIDMSEFPTLRKIYDSCEALPEFQSSLPERQPAAPP
ncbi:hypothetical protein KY290_002179 [Solanum tuberosum]|uniref:GST C-terminal domain-containing protein n=1 Tax=Solanum tuberosum TaxID=4113 RepID=A0ABQ7WQP6_SOLTU|nr:hypothetical protein KY284_002225 [Solanum tuberosum]KAH0731147.1 hypothetical protein KY289_002335 [Solanum tuberosum]KAH0766196.1 hypothetical protein KY285_002067 [Solanum tuberosum]KAH0782581.1 hypothetical protein KY290_002179 [Solanum tuberosum]